MSNNASPALPRPEYPRPQYRRDRWLCLNGEWEFEIDAEDTGNVTEFLEKPFSRRIVVPFCPESELSGNGRSDFMKAVWYRRTVQVPADWGDSEILLHFQAVDYDAVVWANGVEIGRHRGGYTAFTCSLKGICGPGQEVTLAVRARDDHEEPKPQGKQSPKRENYGCLYTRTTGIWQTVWLEPVPASWLGRPRITPEVSTGTLQIECAVRNGRKGQRVSAILRDQQGKVTEATVTLGLDFNPTLRLEIPTERRRLWEPGDPHLYDIELQLLDEQGSSIDQVATYAGLRSVAIDGKAVLINGKTVFQRLVLDQGFYPDGICTAPDDETLLGDIQLGLAAGFNGARLHEKVFEERFLYHADRTGYLVWAEFPDWFGDGYMRWEKGLDGKDASFVAQWLEALERDYSHPCVIGWCALNETHDRSADGISGHDNLVQACFLAAKAMDRTRPVLDVSGYCHRISMADIYDSHDYTQDPKEFAERHAQLCHGNPYVNRKTELPPIQSIPYGGQPYFVSEFGGIWWAPEQEGWGYGERPKSIEEFYERFEKLCTCLLSNPDMFGYCYTQLADVFQEVNGVYTFDRKPKFDNKRLFAVQQRVAAIETVVV